MQRGFRLVRWPEKFRRRSFSHRCRRDLRSRQRRCVQKQSAAARPKQRPLRTGKELSSTRFFYSWRGEGDEEGCGKCEKEHDHVDEAADEKLKRADEPA